MLVPIQTWRLHTNLYNSVGKRFLRIAESQRESLLYYLIRIFTFFLFSDSGLYLLNGHLIFILIYSEWSDTESQQLFAGASLHTASAREI